MTSQNYGFSLVREEDEEGHHLFVLRAEPRRTNKFLFRGLGSGGRKRLRSHQDRRRTCQESFVLDSQDQHSPPLHKSRRFLASGTEHF